MHSISDFLSLPAVIILMGGLFTLLLLKTQNIELVSAIAAINSISSQPFALIVLVLGFWMLVECKKWSIDTTIAGGVIGVASNMLQSQLKDTHSTAVLTNDPPSTSTVSTTIDAKV